MSVRDPGTADFATSALPNPFRLATELRFVMPAASIADVSILDAQGREVRSLVLAARLGAGPQRLAWDGRAEDGTRVRPGLYFARLRCRDAAWTVRLVRLE